jgi:lysophospholipase L1-like esterase
MGFNISKQYRRGKWDWVILNGGGNDLWLGCGCAFCKRKINRMISKDGDKGVIPRLVSRLRKNGARVIYVGYLRSPGVGSLIEHCKDEAKKFEGRISEFAKRDDGVYFLSLVDLVPYGDRSYHALDMIHPSTKGSKAIGDLVANIIQTSEKVPVDMSR